MYPVLRFAHLVIEQLQGVHLREMLVAVAVLSAMSLAYNVASPKLRRKWRHRCRLFLTVAWLACILFVVLDFTLLSRSDGRVGAVEFVPFSHMGDSHDSFKYVVYDILNALLFLPLGCVLAMLFGKRLSRYGWALAFVLCALLSCGIETIQLMCEMGSWETEDIICNSAGAALGVLLCRGVQKEQ